MQWEMKQMQWWSSWLRWWLRWLAAADLIQGKLMLCRRDDGDRQQRREDVSMEDDVDLWNCGIESIKAEQGLRSRGIASILTTMAPRATM
ncbi:unnamed protein product [Linum trigynum]|uniref:Uncharacterized protein n=1 Tax=Linum trigynum TaxID=586398 RepID=A0AAV2DFN7_9ROSI